MWKEIEFGAQAVEYIRSQLSNGMTFGTMLLNLPLEKGTITSCLPEGVDFETLSRFDESITLSTLYVSMAGTTSRVVTFIEDFLNERRQRYAIFETFGRASDDNYRNRRRVPYFISNSEIYYCISPGKNTSQKIRKAWRSARHYPLICGLTTVPQGQPSLEPSQIVSLEMLETLATRTDHILVGAYDMEGYLIWSCAEKNGGSCLKRVHNIIRGKQGNCPADADI